MFRSRDAKFNEQMNQKVKKNRDNLENQDWFEFGLAFEEGHDTQSNYYGESGGIIYEIEKPEEVRETEHEPPTEESLADTNNFTIRKSTSPNKSLLSRPISWLLIQRIKHVQSMKRP